MSGFELEAECSTPSPAASHENHAPKVFCFSRTQSSTFAHHLSAMTCTVFVLQQKQKPPERGAQRALPQESKYLFSASPPDVIRGSASPEANLL
jgi:hypothetical protein